MTDEETIWVSALRYALGRRTYIVDVTAKFIESKLDSISDKCRVVMVRDIQNAEDYGHACDHGTWMRLLDKLKTTPTCNSCGEKTVEDRRGGYLGGYMCISDTCPAGQPLNKPHANPKKI